MVACAVFVAACSSSGPPLVTLSPPPLTSSPAGVQLTTRTLGTMTTQTAPVLVVGNKILLSVPSSTKLTLASIDLTSDGRNATTVWSAPPT